MTDKHKVRRHEAADLIRRDQNLALGCAAGVALLVVVLLLAYLWTL
jgi:hypothetical protein